MRTILLLLTASLLVPGANALLVDDTPVPLDPTGLVEIEMPIAHEGVRTVVGFHEMPDASVESYAGARVLDRDDVLRFLVVDVVDETTFRAQADHDANVRYHEPDQISRAFYTPTDPFWATSDYQWGAKQIKLNLAWDRTRGTTTTRLCVIDSGLQASHQEFSGTTRDLAGYDFVFEDGTPNDPNGHGTHVAGIASAQMNNGVGMAGSSQTTLIPIRVLDGAGNGYDSDIAQGVRYCRDQGGHIASMSLGGPGSTTMRDAVVYAQNGGVLVIAAVGNDGCFCTSYPAGYASVLGVAATDKSNVDASFSNAGASVDISAPGVGIVSSYKDISGCTANACYVYLDGTSMATPFVSAVAALVKSYTPSLTASQISSRLTSTAQDIGSAGRDDLTGYGLVRADLAVV